MSLAHSFRSSFWASAVILTEAEDSALIQLPSAPIAMVLKCPRVVGGMVGLGLKVSKRQQREGVRSTRQVVGGGSCVGNGGAAADSPRVSHTRSHVVAKLEIRIRLAFDAGFRPIRAKQGVCKAHSSLHSSECFDRSHNTKDTLIW